MDSSCLRCGKPLVQDAQFCSFCGAQVQLIEGIPIATIVEEEPVHPALRFLAGASTTVAVAIVVLTLVCMSLMQWFAIPRLAASLASFGGPRSAITRIAFSSWWMPGFMVAVVVLGGAAIFWTKSLAARAGLLIAAMVIGLVPMVGTMGAIYMVSFEEAEGAVGSP